MLARSVSVIKEKSRADIRIRVRIRIVRIREIEPGGEKLQHIRHTTCFIIQFRV